MLQGVLEWLGSLGPWIYAGVGLLTLLEASAFVGLAVPGEAALLLAGFLVLRGEADMLGMMVAATAGAIIGDSIGYEIGRRLGGVIKRRLGQDRWDRATGFLRRHGGKAVLLGRFVGVLRAVVPAAAGASKMPYRKFLLWNALGALVWAPGTIALGYAAGSSYDRVEKWLGRGGLILFALVVLVAVGVWYFRKRARRRAAA